MERNPGHAAVVIFSKSHFMKHFYVLNLGVFVLDVFHVGSRTYVMQLHAQSSRGPQRRSGNFVVLSLLTFLCCQRC